jgi:general secretion pathway protein G
MRSQLVRVTAAGALAACALAAWQLAPGVAAADREPAAPSNLPATKPTATTRPAATAPTTTRNPTARSSVAKENIAQLEVAGMQFELDVGRYPTTAEGLRSLVERPKGADGWHGPYVKRLIDDPWGRPYQYRSPGKHIPTIFDVWSLGPDGRDGTGDDLGNW